MFFGQLKRIPFGIGFYCIGLTASLLMASVVQALGLGDITISSYLGQPLKADIAVVLDVDNYSADEVRVRQVGVAEARELGIELAGYSTSYELVPVDTGDGALAIALSSRKPIHEPFLNLLVELKWPTGTVYREYTLLLDPVELTPTAAPTTAYQAERSVPKPARAQVKQPTLAGTYRVQSGDSLSKIAARLTIDATRQERMQWLLHNNPQAFVNADPNRLLAGAVLTLPSAGDRIAPAEGLTQAPVEPAPVESAPSATATATATFTERLTIVTPDAADSERAGQASPAVDTSEALRNQIVAINETVDSLRRENEAMSKRLQELENAQYVNSLERLLALKDEEINQLKQQAVASNSAPVSATPAPHTESVAAEIEEPRTSEPEASISTARFLWMLCLLIIALTGAVFFFRRWRLQEQKNIPSVGGRRATDGELLQDLDAMIRSQAKFDTYSGQRDSTWDQVVSETEQAFNDLGNGRQRRPEDVVKRSIRDKTSGYVPAQQEHDEKEAHDQLDDVIAVAMAAANTGAYDAAESLLVAERTQQARISTGDSGDVDSRLELALEYVNQLRRDQRNRR